MTGYYDLGNYRRALSTKSPEAQLWFDCGLIWCYGYNHEEAVRCFQLAADADPDCALAHWGIAYAAGPNYNKPTFPSITCGNGPNGDMFMNYMDYVDDDAMFMFTTGQMARMHAALDGARSLIGT